jgi:hypothetical protein
MASYKIDDIYSDSGAPSRASDARTRMYDLLDAYTQSSIEAQDDIDEDLKAEEAARMGTFGDEAFSMGTQGAAIGSMGGPYGAAIGGLIGAGIGTAKGGMDALGYKMGEEDKGFLQSMGELLFDPRSALPTDAMGGSETARGGAAAYEMFGRNRDGMRGPNAAQDFSLMRDKMSPLASEPPPSTFETYGRDTQPFEFDEEFDLELEGL